MIDPSVLFNVSNVLFLIGTSLLIRAVLKCKDILKGYDWLGALLTLLALSCIQVAYLVFIEEGQSSYWISFSTSLLTTAYWALVTAYTIKNRLARGKITVTEIGEIENGNKNRPKRTK